MTGRPLIYVQIPAYRDSELGATLQDLFQSVSDPAAIRVAVLWQRADHETLPDELRCNPSLELIETDYRQSRGCNWARTGLQERWHGEAYTLLLDSHHRFVPQWDLKLIDAYEQLKAEGVRKPLLTAYLPPYLPGDLPSSRSRDPLEIRACGRESGLLVYLRAFPVKRWRLLAGSVPARFSSLHFVFTQGAFNEEVKHDPEVYFFGDEVVLALRAFTCGYDLYHPDFVPGWHLYERTGTRIPHWENRDDEGVDLHERSSRRIRDIYLGLADELMGNARSISEYEAKVGARLIAY